jgi:Flp pilus assembly protein TadD
VKSCQCSPGIQSLIALLIAGLIGACDSPTEIEPTVAAQGLEGPLRFIGSQDCSACHESQFNSWTGSHHNLAMQHATSNSVRGDFDDAVVVHGGVETSFFIRDGGFWVKTDNANGDLEEFEIRYTFGVTPLQQYLIEFSKGRLQTLALAWDDRDEEDGGQRWFHVYGEETITHNDSLHWTGREQNWNYMCAECHSTELHKNFDLDSGAFSTTWSEINVGCEGCHGPGSRHVEMANSGALRGKMGFAVDLDDTGRAIWQMNLDTGIAERSELQMRPPQQAESCGRCHSRRSQITKDYQFGQTLLDTHMPTLLDENLYFPDGQILEEVYVWGSFLQSKMYQAGVTCTDCHDPHTAKLKSNGEVSTVCSTCHLPQKFAATRHHNHDPAQVACVDCHMPSRDYMVVDGRRDHSFRVPRPDLTISTGSPNACENCHAAEGPEWAKQALDNWYGEERPEHFAGVIAAGRNGVAGANDLLADAAGNASFPGIARATALTLMSPPLDSKTAGAIRDGLANADALIRMSALRALAIAPADLRLQLAIPLLADPVRAVRIEAANSLSPVRSEIPQEQIGAFVAAESEYVEAQEAIAERPEAHVNLAAIFAERGDTRLAELSFLRALEMEPLAVTARVNLADLYRQLSRDEDAKELLKIGLELDAESATLLHTYGLLLVRSNQVGEAMSSLERAVNLEPGNARFVYVYAIALNTYGRSDEAISALLAARQSFSGDFDIGWALITILRDAGFTDKARREATLLQNQFPRNQNIAPFIASLTDS